MRVLIYGYGWSGQSALELFEGLGFACCVVDEDLDVENFLDGRFITQEEASHGSFCLVLVCIVEDMVARRVANRLYKQGVPKEIVRYFQTYRYTKKMSKFLKDFFPSKEEVLQICLKDSLKMPRLHARIYDLERAYFQDKRDSAQSLAQWGEKVRAKFPRQNVFSMLYGTSLVQKSIECIAYPGFHVAYSKDRQEDKNFYFVQLVDFQALKHRPKDVKLIACFGNSALRVEYLPLEATITHLLQEKLGNERFIVVNFGVTGYTTYEQLMLYNALVYPLKPEIVLSFFGGTDFRLGYICCEELLKTHHILYTPYFYEKLYKNFVHSDLPLYCEFGVRTEGNLRVKDADVIAAILERLEQFHAQVVRGGGEFLAFIQPLLPCKLEWSQEEQAMRAKEREHIANVAAYQNPIIDTLVPKLVEDLKRQANMRAYDFVLDLNAVLKDSKESLFTNHWIHCNARGNAICADYVYAVLQHRGILQ